MRHKQLGHTAGIRRYAGVIVLSLGIAVVPGCGGGDRPPLGRVHGRITLDGKPLVHASVDFVPQGGGRAATGDTDAAGDYELKYIRDIMGAKVGAHTVRVNGGRDAAGAATTVPDRYNVKSTLKAEVAAGDNVINFDLTTN